MNSTKAVVVGSQIKTYKIDEMVLLFSNGCLCGHSYGSAMAVTLSPQNIHMGLSSVNRVGQYFKGP